MSAESGILARACNLFPSSSFSGVITRVAATAGSVRCDPWQRIGPTFSLRWLLHSTPSPPPIRGGVPQTSHGTDFGKPASTSDEHSLLHPTATVLSASCPRPSVSVGWSVRLFPFPPSLLVFFRGGKSGAEIEDGPNMLVAASSVIEAAA